LISLISINRTQTRRALQEIEARRSLHAPASQSSHRRKAVAGLRRSAWRPSKPPAIADVQLTEEFANNPNPGAFQAGFAFHSGGFGASFEVYLLAAP
jgi:hypothetical protein